MIRYKGMKRYELPAAFYDDHVARDCAAGVVVRRKSRTVVVDLDETAYADLRSDADYYSNPATAADMAYSADSIGAYGLARSAVATLRRLDADPYPGYEPGKRRPLRRYVFGNPGDGYPLTVQANAETEDQARNMCRADLRHTATWPLLRVDDPRCWD